MIGILNTCDASPMELDE